MQILKISRSALQKTFGRSEQFVRDNFKGQELEEELKKVPTPEEEEWMRFFKTTGEDRARARQKMSICAFAEIDDISEHGFSYTYGEDKFDVAGPYNPLKVSMELENSLHAGVIEMCRQGCVKHNDMSLDLAKAKLPVDSIQLLVSLINRFFFMISGG